MNKILLLIVSFLIILSPLFGQKKTDEPNLKKGIKTETVLKYGYEDKFGKYEEVLEDKFIYQYDFNGNKVEYLRYDSTGSLSWRYIYKYELNENIFIESTHKTDGSLLSKTIKKNNSNRKIVEKSEFDSKEFLKKRFIYQ